MKKLNVITLFSGYDSQCLALKRLGVDYDLIGWSEIDKYAIQAHNALFPQFADRNLGDITKIDWSVVKEPIDLMTYSSPCQDFSNAGLQKGGEEGSGTRSGLLWECEKAIKALRPKYLVFENVAALVSEKFIGVFNKWQARLNEYGYTNFQQLMNAKDMGVPQNRLRIFMVSVLDCDKQYHFPKPFKLERRLKDVLEQNVEERYYLSDERVAKLMQETAIYSDRGNGFAFRPHTPEEIASTVKCSGIGDKTDNFVVEPKVEIIAEPQDNVMLGWTRSNTGKGDPTYHPVNVANSPTIMASQNELLRYEGTAPSVIEPTIIDATNDFSEEEKRTYTEYSPALRSSRSGLMTIENASVAKDNLLVEPAILAPVRTEYGKAVRKLYGDNNLPESRHNLTVLQPKQDGTSNTLTSVTKDNLLIEPRCQQIGNIHEGESNPQSGRVYSAEGISPTIDCCQGGNREPKIIEDFYGTVRDPRVYTDEAPTLRADRTGLMATEGIRIRRLTERELYRLMDVEEKDIDTLLNSGIAKTQHAKLAGNSIVVSCLYYIFDRLLVHTEAQENEQLTLF